MDLSPLTTTQQAQTASSTAFSSLTENLDTFLTLLTTQLQHQDPLEPLDTEQFTQQLVQFAGVEQSIQTNSYLERLISLQSASDRAGALDMIGRSIVSNSPIAAFDGTTATWVYEVGSAAADIKLSIYDANDALIALVDAEAGENSFEWNGVTSTGEKAPEGIYRLSVEAIDVGGNSIPAQISTYLDVTGVSFSNDGPQLETTAGLVDLNSVIRAFSK